jgi:ATP-binding cassette, subfamily C, bacterial
MAKKRKDTQSPQNLNGGMEPAPQKSNRWLAKLLGASDQGKFDPDIPVAEPLPDIKAEPVSTVRTAEDDAPQLAKEDTAQQETVPESSKAADNAAEVTPPAKKTPPRPNASRAILTTIEADQGPVKAKPSSEASVHSAGNSNQKSGQGKFHKRLGAQDFTKALDTARRAIRGNLSIVMLFTVASNILILAIPVYLFQISDRVLTSRSIDTLLMLTAVIVGAVLLQAALDAMRRFILMRTAVEVAVQLGSPILSAA